VSRPERSLRCAIYTRKSTEEGLEQEFNSLDAQREACSAYILSQRHEGWSLIPEQYDDGGFSGGSMNRPALQQLLTDVRTGKVDIIVVYKVDRLTRSLADFAKIVEVLDEKGASFVSVTQAFNTTTSMGRLTLNVLLSFAQFEREVTGERIRDKIAASKKKGLWMGGPVPLGYEVQDRKLVVHEIEAETVRHLFRRYLDMGSVREMIEVLDREGVRTKVQIRASGPHRGGIPFARGTLYYLLRNRTYLGEIVHKGGSYPGEHQSIVPRDLWDAVQEKLAINAKAQKLQKRARHTSLLAGLLHDGLGRRMSPSHASKQGKRYRYYVTHEQQRTDRSEPAWRVPAHDIEQVVLDRLDDFFSDGAGLLEQFGEEAEQAETEMLERADQARGILATGSSTARREFLLQSIERIDLHDDRLEIILHLSALLPESQRNHVLVQPVERQRRGHEVKLLVPGTDTPEVKYDPRLVSLVAEAHSLRRMVLAQSGSLSQIAARLGMCRARMADMMRLSWLAPDIVTSILDGAQPESLTRARLNGTSLSPDWDEQRRQLGLS
jgi:DNA invertase Pin-like site-specific DNA recombinase